MKHPGIHDICDIAVLLFPWFPRVAYEITTVMLCLNNIMACVGFHVFTGAKSESSDIRTGRGPAERLEAVHPPDYRISGSGAGDKTRRPAIPCRALGAHTGSHTVFNTLSDHSTCTVWYMVITTVIGSGCLPVLGPPLIPSHRVAPPHAGARVAHVRYLGHRDGNCARARAHLCGDRRPPRGRRYGGWGVAEPRSCQVVWRLAERRAADIHQRLQCGPQVRAVCGGTCP